jgi:hypothetical protein
MSPEAAAVLETLPEPRQRKRVAMWTLIVWTALMGVWIIGAGASNTGNCAGETGDALKLCQDATAVGTGIGVSLLVALWAFGLFCIMTVTVIVRLGRSNG